MPEKKILLLRSCKDDFAKIVSWEMKFRYLEVKKYWESRVLEQDGVPKIFDEIHIKNGYSSDSPLAIVEFKGNLGIFEHEGKDCFKIELGKVLEVRNYNSK